MPVYLIGGSVRDLLLCVPSPDLDLSVVGDGIAFAQALARELHASASEQRRFMTAKVKATGGDIDVATARRETYSRPGALPQVTPGAIEDDLARRDFTVNALAIRLDDRAPRRLVDPFGGCDDLAPRRLRVLHPQSFIDDPTRLLRAARYAARLGFRLERTTRRLAKEAARGGCLDTVSGDRIRRELMLLLDEPAAAKGVALCARLGILASIQPSLEADARTLAALRAAGGVCRRLSRGASGVHIDCGLVRLLILAGRLSPREASRFMRRLGLSARQAQALKGYLERGARVQRTLARPNLRNSAIARALEGLSLEGVAALAATSPRIAGERCELFVKRLRDLRARIRGDDLAQLGFAPGPAWRRALAAARDARLDGRARTREDELRIAQSVLRRAAR
jgi:tRNA nucleotidyltransferase (CCA-adding enzyme)